ncbi:hypothetical protein [Chitinophaga caseinilytica]|uniref:Uncharacterized protein n=1 Tax=Chitinophaga caseinilytica TaxID=2267521 RepID=A0ABZ2ZAR9_9BACT
MPYDFTFKRTIELDNQTALVRNISLAKALTESFSEITDLNLPNPDFHFSKTVIDSEKEFPEQHFYLEADIDGCYYIFSFWKDNLYVELGAGGNMDRRFNHLRDCSEIILDHDFQIQSPTEGKLLTTDIGFEQHIEAYKEWVSFIDKVRKIRNSSE